MKARRLVHLPAETKPKERLWAYSYRSLAALLDIKPATVRSLVGRGQLDPGDLGSVVRLVLVRASRAVAETYPPLPDRNASLAERVEALRRCVATPSFIDVAASPESPSPAKATRGARPRHPRLRPATGSP